MRRILALFACTFALWTVDAAEESVAPPTAARTEAAPVFEQVSIANDLIRVVLSAQRGGVVRYELLDERPVKLPPTLRKRLGSEEASDPDQALALLDNFRRDVRSHYNLHNLLDFANSVGPNLDGTAPVPWSIAERGDSHVSFIGDFAERGLRLRLDYRLEPGQPRLLVVWTITNTSGEAITVAPRVYPVMGIHQDFGPNEAYYLTTAGHANGKMSTVSLPSPGELAERIGGSELDYAVLRSRFFGALWSPVSPEIAAAAATPSQVRDLSDLSGPPRVAGTSGAGTATGVRDVVVQSFRGLYTQPFMRVDYADVQIAPGADHQVSWSLTGTSTTKVALARLTEDERKVQYTDGFYRFFKVLANALAWCLDMIAIVVRNYGVALIILTCLIKLALHRTTFKQQSSLLKMSKLAPEIKLLQERYKNDRQQLGVKTMELYKKHGVNPLGGCLPILIQMPMFMALYQVFTHSADFRNSGFLWISDLTLEDAIWGINNPWFHWLTINPLALIYIGVTLWMSFQHKIPEGADPQQAQMQKMMRWLPLVFGIIFYHMPTGLVLYFTINAILSTIEIKMVKRKLGMP